MEDILTLTNVGLALTGTLVGFLISKILEKFSVSKTLNHAKSEAERIIKSSKIEGENLKKDKIFQAKERFLELKTEHEKHILNREKDLTEVQKRIKDKESQLSNELSVNKKNNQSLTDKINSFNKKIELYDKKHLQLEKMHKEQITKLEKISTLSATEAKKELLKSLTEETKTEALELTQNIIEEAKLSARQDAKKIIINTIVNIQNNSAYWIFKRIFDIVMCFLLLPLLIFFTALFFFLNIYKFFILGYYFFSFYICLFTIRN